MSTNARAQRLEARRRDGGGELGHRDGVAGVGVEARVGSSAALARVSLALSRAAASLSGGESAAKTMARARVIIENGQTFEREAIQGWFKKCKDSGRRPTCPLTHKELRSTELNPSIALRNTIEEWTKRNEAAQLDKACRTLCLGALKLRFCKLIPLISDMLKSGSRRVRLKALETLRVVAEDDDDNKVALYICFVEFPEASGHSGKCENNVRQMAENGRLQPLLTLLLEGDPIIKLCANLGGSPETQLSMAAYLGELVLSNDVKIFVAQTAGSILVEVMRSGRL
ncbi:hypothetical protein ZIOFF_032814 [Zingiber officinale]|uniref:RING-type E3 ubiquitin transferase n=1 Tax=Zingiber officinale TaxID=94328 RepID=A0A8J5L1H0_ZINOF|nr:hypothetical protein ZIOFF_032814 [Zingiber officinale]